MEVPPRPKLFDFHGVALTQYFTENWENLQNFQARPDDVYISSYPKAGSTWLTYLLDLLHFSASSPERETSLPIHERAPVLEASFPTLKTGTEQVDNLMTSPRLIKIHFPVQFMPKSVWEQNCKVVHVVRNAKDSVVSFYHYERMTLTMPEPGDWSSYLQRFMEGNMLYGSWYDHATGWWKKAQSYPNLHFMFYEDMVEDSGKEIDKLCCFLGLSPSAEEKERIMEKVKFDSMKTNNLVNNSHFPMMDFKVSTFIRKGKVGDWRNHFTLTQNEVFDAHYKEKMTDPTLQFRTEL